MKNLYFFVPALSLSIVSGSVYGQSEQPIYELVTTAIHQKSDDTALPITVLVGDELRAMSRATLGETLATQPGINNASFGPAVGQPVIRGQQGRRVLNLINGVATADASGNSADHAITIEAILADSIEVLRGPSTLLYGSGAIGGVVNVIDSRIANVVPEKPHVSIEARHDTVSDFDTFIGRADFSTGNFVWHLDGVKKQWNDLEIPGLAIDPRYLDDDHEEHEEDEEHEEEHEDEIENTDGYVENTDGELDSITAGLSYVFDQGFIGFSVSELNNTYGLPAGAHEHHEEDHEDEDHEDEDEDHDHEEEGHEDGVKIDMSSRRYDVIGQWKNEGGFVELLDYKVSYTDYSHAEIEGSGEVGTRFSNDSWQQRVQINHQELNGWHGVLGLQNLNQDFAAVGEESFIAPVTIRSQGVFWVEDFHKDNITLELGARLNRDKYDAQAGELPSSSFSTQSYSASALWDVSAPVSMGLNLSHSERAPSIEELYSNYGLVDIDACVIHLATASCERGNASLNEESGFNTDLTLAFDWDRYSINLNAFYNRFNDYIYQQDLGLEVDEFAVREYTQQDAWFAGYEFELSIVLADQWQLEMFADTVKSELENNDNVPRMPPTRLGSTLRYETNGWSGFLSMTHAFEQSDTAPNEFSTNAYTRWDIGADYRIDVSNSAELLFFIKGRNLGNEEIRHSASFLRGFAPEAGRSIETGVRYSF